MASQHLFTPGKCRQIPRRARLAASTLLDGSGEMDLDDALCSDGTLRVLCVLLTFASFVRDCHVILGVECSTYKYIFPYSRSAHRKSSVYLFPSYPNPRRRLCSSIASCCFLLCYFKRELLGSSCFQSYHSTIEHLWFDSYNHGTDTKVPRRSHQKRHPSLRSYLHVDAGTRYATSEPP